MSIGTDILLYVYGNWIDASQVKHELRRQTLYNYTQC